jgi:dihydroorotate dehydrogenase
MLQLLYRLIRPLLFCLNPETAHHLSLKLIACYNQCLPQYTLRQQPCQVMGLTFPNAIGLAAGFDKNGRYFHHLGRLGFGFIEIGTVTPRPQPGNNKPRIFRLKQHQAIINRLGFNNDGVDALVDHVKRYRKHYPGILGINIGKNAATPMDQALDDYLACFHKVYPLADYISINISSPNTKNLRQLQSQDAFNQLCEALKKAQKQGQQKHQRYVPIAIKIAPDLSVKECAELAQTLLKHQIDAVIATNTTISRPETLKNTPNSQETGGLSGAPLYDIATPIITTLATNLKGKLPIIAVGGINSQQRIQERLAQGASLVQCYTALAYDFDKF